MIEGIRGTGCTYYLTLSFKGNTSTQVTDTIIVVTDVGDTAIDDVWLGTGQECLNAKDRMNAETKGMLVVFTYASPVLYSLSVKHFGLHH